MNNEEPRDLTAKNSKCWNCKFGMCLDETQRQTVVHQGMVMLEDDEESPFGHDMFDPELAAEPQQVPPRVHMVDSVRSGAMCYWGPQKVGERQPPIRVEFVDECSRYEVDEGASE